MRKYDYSQPVILKDYEEDFGLEIPRRYDVNMELSSLVKDFEWQITYKFTDEVRNNVFGTNPINGKDITYGGYEMSFRRLYVILCEKFNLGKYFIEEYFDTVYPNTMKQKVDDYLKKLKDDMISEFNSLTENVDKSNEAVRRAEGRSEKTQEELDSAYLELDSIMSDMENPDLKRTKSGKLDRRVKANRELFLKELEAEDEIARILKKQSRQEKNKERFEINLSDAKRRLSDFQVLKSQRVKNEGNYLAKLVKDNIVVSLESGAIPLHPKLISAKTQYLRNRAGLPSAPKFFASGQLINNVMIFFRLEKKTWQTVQGTMV